MIKALEREKLSRWHYRNDTINQYLYSQGIYRETLLLIKGYHKIDIITSKYKIFVSPRYHQNADKHFLTHCEYIGPSDKKRRQGSNKWYQYRTKNYVSEYTPRKYDIYLPKKNLLEDFYQVDCLHISFPNNDAFRHISKVLDPTTDIWNKDKEKK